MEPSELQVLSAFLKENSREDLKVIALHEILGSNRKYCRL